MADADAAAALRDMPRAEMAKHLLQVLSTSAPMPLRPQDAALLEGAEAFRFGTDDSRCAWSVGQGPLVLMVHGWGGRGVQMAPLANTLASAGYRCVFFDAGGHGDSRREPIGFDTFIKDAAALSDHVGEAVHAWIGHSAGGLGMMASRALKSVQADRYVCIAAPRFPYVPLETLKSRFSASDPVLDLVKPTLAAQFETDWRSLEAGAAYAPAGASKLLLAYDFDDERVRHADAERIAEGWPGAQILKTEMLGHNKILRSLQVAARTLAFLDSGG
ncbi:MAG: alpha/beta hydrolase [Phenylobacterium sp.]|uniref:alpha/beta hydrolase n=1 Tax=Phenylobacterium sp. TaxID=1871053 RepID=UPI0027354267|nr:alpha/beta hydrolase [Phenylobacterium sp.]MDP3749617.1 alpha/beta hydrolase [Phenylobacterium sp.]